MVSVFDQINLVLILVFISGLGYCWPEESIFSFDLDQNSLLLLFLVLLDLSLVMVYGLVFRLIVLVELGIHCRFVFRFSCSAIK